MISENKSHNTFEQQIKNYLKENLEVSLDKDIPNWSDNKEYLIIKLAFRDDEKPFLTDRIEL